MGEVIDLDEAAALMPGRRPHRRTLLRWAAQGRLVAGTRVRLRTIPTTDGMATTPEWVQAFLAECQAARWRGAPQRTRRSREPQIKRAVHWLRQRGAA